MVGVLSTSGADVHGGGVSLHAWGRLAAALVAASGTVPILLAVTGPCVSGPALLLGLADHVVMTEDAFAYVTGPASVVGTTGVATSHRLLGGASVHATTTGVASWVVSRADEVADAVALLLSYLPSNSLDDPPFVPTGDPPARRCERAGAVVPVQASASYDVRDVLDDVLDEGSFCEVRTSHAQNVVTGYGRVAGRSVGVVANQPLWRAGTLDIDGSRKGARLVQSCDAFNLPLLTVVDTPGFEPGRDLEWRGIIRHGAQLVHAYAEATVPRVCLVLRKAFGGAYIVMDSKTLGNDLCLAWPGAQIAVMGAPGAVGILSRRASAEERARLEAEYVAEYLNPWRAAARGLVDEVIEPTQTRAAVAAGLARLASKAAPVRKRRHSNGPL